MSRLLGTSGPGFFRSPILRLLGVGNDGPRLEDSATRVAEGPSAADAEDVQLSRPSSFIAADRDHDAENVDAVAGSEFVDDQIRLQE